MKTIQFRNGDTAHSVGLGTWKAKGEDVTRAVADAIRMGYRHIDTAAVYENESDIGKALKEVMDEGIVSREELFITSKLWNDAHAPEDVIPALKESLEKLGLDYLDLYLIHWPVAFKKGVGFPTSPDEYIPLQDLPSELTWEQMEEAHRQGLAKHIGVSNFSVPKLEKLIDSCQIIPEMNQVELHPLLQQNELKSYCDQHHIHLTAYSPLGSGDRPEGMKAANEPSLFGIPEIKEVAAKHGVSPAQVLIGWHAERGSAVIPKSTNPSHMASNLEAGSLQFDKDDMTKIASVDRGFRFIDGTFFEMPGSGYSNIYDQ